MINDKIENNHNVIEFNNNVKNQSTSIESNKKTIKNSKFFSNVLILILCALISKIIGAIYRVPLLKILGSLGIGQYQMILSIFSLFLVLSCSGITVAISKLISKETQFNNKKNQKQYVVSGLIKSNGSSPTL